MLYSKNIDTPLGEMIAVADNRGIYLLEFADKKLLDNELKKLGLILNRSIKEASNLHLETLEKELELYFNESLKEFSVPIQLLGTPFQKKVWQTLLKIPYGTTKSYLQQAIMMGSPKAVRAVANANSLNRIAIVVPCHRVIGSNGSLTGYAGGLRRKEKLLQLEKSLIHQ
ncbi:methylated-DNA--[protein]-cysteine S-methyltransferase [Riemerella anatipestifer]|uniref:Methylated-DNA--protein-cysteine methyltransferase n=1 Tax=Riemerella anatipestifer TaxID=34085 RepID=A0A1S7DU51_RIEAN|nr:methylated-DNA--[protein]-cysteine S-methyltransferase [Riemerella anatipestifer]AQY22645.1 Methylated-DNA--protein-cysteine methyltransferase, constitutive [Riemerella anatipestifer]MBO4232754.1 methylated-DNA--[protein]-cysteine S-methyltransferase [Riemerella anatipestifer]MCO4303663.1 methylated-DNA--[protein]-cysteine S-methyltransferase [Riemerella anatipestifer]MCO7352154.1 methylated-DNA--[protein]-cysteine S-methyltransferase [Riemerella anatipestifer]MCQ4039672.1 methylated-DNA--[